MHLELETAPHIVQGNALRLDWREVLPPADCSYVLGNPPFVGKQFRNPEQQSDMEIVWNGVSGAGVLDYVTCWYRKAADYISGNRVRVALVSTNSITQGEQVGILWGDLFGRFQLKIHFAHRTFKWISEARGSAHVHVVIIGFGNDNPPIKRIYEYDGRTDQATVSEVANISPYLVAGNDIVVVTRSSPLCGQPKIVFGSMPNDGGHLLLSDTARRELLAQEPGAARYIRPLLGSDEFLNGVNRWCLWLANAEPGELRRLPQVMRRVEAVRRYRQASSRIATQALANTPTRFGEIRQPVGEYLLIPGVSSENRRYIPMAFMSPEVIGTNLVYCMEEANRWHFGILSSVMHMSWVRAVCGRLESRYRYSNKLVYNNFPWPQEVEERRRLAVERAAQAVLDARTPFLSPTGSSTLADLYDPLTMPSQLADAHANLDRAVDRCYRVDAFRSERERVEYLFRLYEQLATPLLRSRQSRRRVTRSEE